MTTIAATASVMRLAEQERRPWLLTATATASSRLPLTRSLRSEGMRVIRAPMAAPRAKAHAERWGRQRSARVPRSHPDRLPLASRGGPPRVRRLLQHAPAAPLTPPATASPQADPRPCTRPRVACSSARPSRRPTPPVRTRRIAIPDCDLERPPDPDAPAIVRPIIQLGGLNSIQIAPFPPEPTPVSQTSDRTPDSTHVELLGPTRSTAAAQRRAAWTVTR
jgi:hypothetical protein